MKAVGRAQLSGSTEEIAQRLLGMRLVREREGRLQVGCIVETEAYLGPHDLACHTAKGRTARNEVMFGAPGHAYVYFIYGMYHCVNVVTEPGAAVLIRALEPLENIDVRCDGPGRLCRVLDIDKALNGHDLCCASELWLEGGERPEKIVKTARIGVDYAGTWAKKKLRFFIKGARHSRA
jgi:DNA-3-methyladenine glycosylase